MRSSLFLALLIVGCGGNVAAEATDAGGDTPSTVPTTTPTSSPTSSPTTTPVDPPPGARPPPRPSTVSSGGATVWFAVSRFQLGLTNRTTGIASPTAWADYGYDLDSRTTTKEMSKTSANSCKRLAGSPTNVLTDGNEGRDNNFGQHVMSVIKSLKADAEESVNGGISAGDATLLLKLTNVTGSDNANVPGELYVAARRDSCGSGWPIDFRSLDSSKNAKVQFPNGYLAGGQWVSGEFGKETIQLPLPWMGSLLQLNLNAGIITLNVKSGTGMIGGAAPPSAVLSALNPLMIRYGICPGNATYEQVAATLTQSSDLFIGAPQLQDPTQNCNAVSVGLGFVAQPITAPTCNTGGLEEPPGGCGG